MTADPQRWTNTCPGNFSRVFPEVEQGDPKEAVRLACAAFKEWKSTPLQERVRCLSKVRDALAAEKENLALLIAGEVGKPLREARLELDAVIAKFDFAFRDAEEFLADRKVEGGPHPALVRARPAGPAAVIAPFNFPLHLGHGATTAYLLAGCPVLFKPSPIAANTAAAYGKILNHHLPEGVFQIVQGWGAVARELCMDPRVRSVCFTGSHPVGVSLAKELATDLSKSLALELGGLSTLIVCGDANLDDAATAAADGICLTAGQRCNATSRILVDEKVSDAFIEKLSHSLQRYQPGDPVLETTTLGPVATAAAFDRYQRLINTPGDWVIAGQADGANGYFAKPAVYRAAEPAALGNGEFFAPLAILLPFENTSAALELQRFDHMGLTASVFTESDEVFGFFAGELEVGNLYRNLPTTFSPSTLPFGGFLDAGNGKPGGRGFARFAAREQAVQWKKSP